MLFLFIIFSPILFFVIGKVTLYHFGFGVKAFQSLFLTSKKSRILIPEEKRILYSYNSNKFLIFALILVLIFIVIAYKPKLMLFLIMLIYVLSGPLITLPNLFWKHSRPQGTIKGAVGKKDWEISATKEEKTV